MSMSMIMKPIHDKQHDDREKAREKYGDKGAQAVLDHQNDGFRKLKTMSDAISNTGDVLGYNPLSVGLGAVIGAIDGGLSGPSDDEIRERINAKKNTL